MDKVAQFAELLLIRCAGWMQRPRMNSLTPLAWNQDVNFRHCCRSQLLFDGLFAVDCAGRED